VNQQRLNAEMAYKHVMRLITVAVSFAASIGLAVADARDGSLCPPGDFAAVIAGAAVVDCTASSIQANATTGKSPLDHEGTASHPVITEPVTRSKAFIYRVRRSGQPSGETIVLLHGSGGNETSLFRLAAHIAPDATLLGVRGRVVQKGLNRWYARLSPVEFDQADIREEARAFVASLEAKMATERLDPERTIFTGYSNGANLIAAMALFYPDLVRRAVLLRAMPVLTAAPAADLRRARFLSVPGKVDMLYGPFAPALETLLRDRGALVDSRMVAGGHFLDEEDIKVVGDWLKAANAVAGGATAQ
jgi:phospholipase/carboxylesterase